jgi:peptidoglycan/xylan/chitin deacetylase (PgdA/CDA1 family)
MPSPVIVAYHAVSSTWRSPIAVSEATLRAQVELFRRNGFVGLTLAECERRRSAGTLPERCLVVTFDDGFRTVLRAKPILDDVGFPATVFVVTELVGSPLEWPGLESVGLARADDRTALGWSELERLRADGWEVASHTMTHPVLVDLDDDALEVELARSRADVAAHLGSCETIAYPYGLADVRVARAAERAGYLAGVTLTRAHSADERYLRPRVNLCSEDVGLRLRLTVSRPGLRLRRTRLLAALDRRAARPSWIPSARPLETEPKEMRCPPT